MSNLKTLQKIASSLGLVLGLGLGYGNAVYGATPETAPTELKVLLEQIETNANERDLSGVMAQYSSNFSHSDGLDRSGFEQALQQLWEQYSRLNYRTELQSWENENQGFIVETVTYITGIQRQDGQDVELQSTVRSRQYLENNQVVRQEILSENTQLLMGDNPPEVRVNLPEEIGVGDRFNFDAIVTEPLNNDVLLGAALEEQVGGNAYLNPSTLELQLLPAGGIFKQGKAPLLPDNLWLSAVIVRGDGITIVTQRLRVIED